MKQNKKDKFYEELVASVKEDFLKRREEQLEENADTKAYTIKTLTISMKNVRIYWQ